MYLRDKYRTELPSGDGPKEMLRSGFARLPGTEAWLLALLSFLFVLPLLGGTYWMYLQSKHEIERDELQSDLLYARTLSALTEQNLTSAQHILTSIADRKSFQNEWAKRDVEGIGKNLDDAMRLEPAFLFVSVCELDGTMRTMQPPDQVIGWNFSYREWFRGVSSEWKPYVSGVYRTAVAPHPLVVAVAVPIRGSDEKPAGVLMATYSLGDLSNKFRSLEHGAKADFYAVDQHGTVAASRETMEQSDPVRTPAVEATQRALAGEEGSGRFPVAGKNAYVGFVPVPRLRWGVLYVRSEGDVLAPALHLKGQYRTVAILLLLIYVATAALAAIMIRRQSQLLDANQKLNRDMERQQEALIFAKEEAERSNRFKDQFLSTMSHELRTPLNAVVGFSDLLTEEHYGPLNEKQKRYVQHIQNGGKHLLRLINDILDLSKIEAGRLQLALENISVKNTINEALDTMRPLADKKQHQLLQHTEAGLSVRADGTRFRQMLLNLVGNAIKFTPENGTIELCAQKLGDVARLEVRDSGPGIPPEEQQRIFEAFYRLGRSSKATEGTGLGLAITRRLVELHGGHLGIESQPGTGSCFFFTLPLAPEPRIAASQDAGPPLLVDENPKILVIEDDKHSAHLLQSQLTSAGFEVTICKQPERALEMAAELQPSAITLDVIMKPINGWSLLPALKSDPRTAGIPVIVVSIVDQPTTGALLGADEYIVKPVNKGNLLTALQKCLNQRGRSGRKINIVVVEDDSATRELIAELLSESSYHVTTAADGKEGRARIADANPDLVILDLVLPEVSGFQLLMEMRSNARTADLPVFILTSKDLSLEEKDYIRTHKGELFRKQQKWQDELVRHLHRVVRPVAVSVK